MAPVVTNAFDPVTITLLGEPVAWARTRRNKAGFLFNPQKQQRNAEALRWLAKKEMVEREPFQCAVRVDLLAEFQIPESWPKKKKSEALCGNIRPAKIPDLSNIAKQVEDALNRIVFRDDALIVEYGTLRKVYGNEPKVVVTVRPIEALREMAS